MALRAALRRHVARCDGTANPADGKGLPKGARVRCAALPPGLLAVFLAQPAADAVSDNAARVYDSFEGAARVSISDAQRRPLPRGNFIGTVHHGLPPDLLTPRVMKRDHLAFLGRICPEKSPDRAIRIARAAGMKLKIAAKIDRSDREYFETTIRPMIDGDQIELIGEIGEAEKSVFLSGAKALLLPIDWPEPFRLHRRFGARGDRSRRNRLHRPRRNRGGRRRIPPGSAFHDRHP